MAIGVVVGLTSSGLVPVCDQALWPLKGCIPIKAFDLCMTTQVFFSFYIISLISLEMAIFPSIDSMNDATIPPMTTMFFFFISSTLKLTETTFIPVAIVTQVFFAHCKCAPFSPKGKKKVL